MLLIVVLFNVATACIPIRFWYQWGLHLWLLLTEALLLVYHHDPLSTSCNPTERILMGLRQETMQAKPLVHPFLSIHHGVKFSMPVSVLHQPFWKFCVYLYLGFAALSLGHLLHIVVVHILHAFTHVKELVSLKVLFMLSNVLLCGIL
jgi:hypothetical protein